MLKKLPIEKIKSDILGKHYELSFAFIDPTRSKFLNNKYRKINKTTDILSFPLSKDFGEILICRDVAKIKASKFRMTFPNYLLFLVIHGCLHLKGLKHGVKMERYEFTHYSRYRHRNI